MSTSASIRSATSTTAALGARALGPVAPRDAFPLLAADPALRYLDSVSYTHLTLPTN